MNFGEQLKALRKQIGKSQAQVAREICQAFPDADMSQTYVSALEHRATFPRQQTLEILAGYYDVPVSYFVDAIGAQNARKGVEGAKEYLRQLGRRDIPYRNPVVATVRDTDDEGFLHEM